MSLDPNLPEDAANHQWAADGPPKGIRIRIPIAVGVVVAVALLGMFGGAQLKSANASTTVTSSASGANGTRRNGGGGAGANGAGANGQRGGTFGTVQSVNGNTITITDQQGATKTVTLASNTTITKSDTGSASDITTGETIVVRGTTNSDGSTTAQSVNIGNGGFGPGGFGGGGFPGGGPPPGNSSASGN